MKKLVLLFTAIAISFILNGQTVAFIERNTDTDETFFVQVNERIKKLKLTGFLNYDYLNENELILWKLFSIEKLNLKTGETNILIDNLKPEVLDFDLVNDNVYFMQSEEHLRLEKNSCTLKKLNLTSGNIEVIKLPNGMNCSNMNVSPSEKYIVFEHQKLLPDTEEQYENYLMLYNFETKELTEVWKSGRLTDDIQFKATVWSGDTLVYFKENYWRPENEISQRFLGMISSYDLETKKVNYNIRDFLYGLESFDYFDNCFYVITKNDIVYKMEDNIAKTVYSLKGKGYLNQLKVIKSSNNR